MCRAHPRRKEVNKSKPLCARAPVVFWLNLNVANPAMMFSPRSQPKPPAGPNQLFAPAEPPSKWPCSGPCPGPTRPPPASMQHRSVSFIQVGPLGHFVRISVTTPIARALKNYSSWDFLEVSTDIFLPNSGSRWQFHFRNRHTAVSEVKRPLHGGFGSETVQNLTAICNGHSPTDTSARSGVTVM